jgi:DNA-binding MarR family transcriptional regulator
MKSPTLSPVLESALMQLKEEISLNREYTGLPEAALLSLVWTWDVLETVGRRFFESHGLTDAQFNALMILWDYRDQTLRQNDLARLLVVNQASMGSVLERMERNGWISRSPDPADRRALLVSLNKAGTEKLKEVRAPYYRLVANLFEGSSEEQLQRHILFCGRLRARVRELEARGRAPAKAKGRKPMA